MVQPVVSFVVIDPGDGGGGGGGGGSTPPPVITSNGGGNTAALSIAENRTAVTTVTATSTNTIVYSISGGLDAARFGINSATGALAFLAAPNFENPTDNGANNIYDVVVRASIGTGWDDQALAITVTNVNEAPVITSNGGGASAAITINEGTRAVTSVLATDPEGAGTILYSIAGGADAARFQIDIDTGALTFALLPNFETPNDVGFNNVYDVIVRASDGSLFDDQALAVTVANVNETPVITSNGGGASAAITLAENTTAVTTVTATDIDQGTALAYSIVGGADAARFAINAATGALAFKAGPDFDIAGDVGANNVYDVVVRASDGTLFDDQALAITITNVNEAPVIASNGGGVSAAITLNEGTRAVTTVLAADPEGAGTVIYSISGGADAARFQIDIDTGALTFALLPNFEAPTDVGSNNVYEVIVRASDGSLFDDQALAVTVANVNETPVITSNGGGASAAITLAENTSAVTTVTATDVDLGTTLAYSIIGGADAARFAINAATGALAFRAGPDFDIAGDVGANNVYDVVVRASDGTLFDDQALAITITNVNEAPVIGSNGGGATAAITMSENTAAVTTVAATDPDAGVTVTYSIAGGADAAKFAINAATGALTFKSAPDFDIAGDAGANNVYDVIVRASDGTLFDEQAIAVTLTNVDEPTVITSNGGGATAAISMAENGTAVTTVVATDPDAGTVITYSITGGADAARFAINSATGALRFTSAPNFEAPGDVGANNVYDVIVRASSGSQIDEQAIAVTVTDVNEFAPVISSGGGETAVITVNEVNAAVIAGGGVVPPTGTTIVATDSDGAANLTYSIIGGADASLFTIIQNGFLLLNTTVDFEMPRDVGADNTYDVTVQVSDGTFSDTQQIALKVANVDEAPIVVVPAGTSSTINENTLIANYLGVFEPDGSQLTYTLLGPDAAKFQLVTTSPQVLQPLQTRPAVVELRFIAAPDFEKPGDAGADNVYNVTVRTSDGASSVDQVFSVTVANVREAPIIPPTTNIIDATGVTISENSTAVTTVVALSEPGATITYAITGGPDASRFAIDATTGALRFLSAPDFEAPTDAAAPGLSNAGDNIYALTVRASDGLLFDDQQFYVEVTNLNEAPIISSNGGGATASITRAENTTAVITVTAADPDGSTTLVYSIAGGVDAARFAINASTGALTFKTAPDFEIPGDVGANNVYDVIVRASDGTLFDDQALAVTVTNANDQVPVITSGGGGAAAAISVAEQLTAVTTIAAQDNDLGSTIAYSIIGGADAARFSINGATGALTFRTAPDFEAPGDAGGNNVYDVTVRASDGTFFDDQALVITVTDILDRFTGTDSADNFTAATNVNWTVTGLGGNDILLGRNGDDTIDGGDGFDFIRGGTGTNRLFGGLGSDTISYSNATTAVTVNLSIQTSQNTGWSNDLLIGFESLVGSNFDDTLTGNSGANTLTGGDGNDSLFGAGGNDTLIGGNGVNFMDGGDGIDLVSYARATKSVVAELVLISALDPRFGLQDSFVAVENIAGSTFDDILTGNGGANEISGDAGNDTLSGAGGNDLLIGGAGTDLIDGGAGIDTASYADSATRVTINLTLTGPQVDTGAGADTLVSIENLIGSNVGDSLTGDDQANSLSGGFGNDVLVGNGGSDLLDGGIGDDRIDGGGAAAGAAIDNSIDTASYASARAAVTVNLALSGAQNTGGAGNDTLIGIEALIGSDFNDSLFGNNGDNNLRGGAGNDILNGGNGADYLYGGTGLDTMVGGAGIDRFVFNEAPTAGVFDTLADFRSGEDRIVLDSRVFQAPGVVQPSLGVLPASAFGLGTVATTASQRLLFDPVSKSLFFDADGAGGLAAIKFAELPNLAMLAASDIIIV